MNHEKRVLAGVQERSIEWEHRRLMWMSIRKRKKETPVEQEKSILQENEELTAQNPKQYRILKER